MNQLINTKTHPCFNVEAKHTYARVHLPIAPDCNINCNYCNRRNDCINESRPGVSSAILNPSQAVDYLEKIVAEVPNLSVVGVAGPGDPFAKPELTIKALNLVREKFPHLLMCLASNGLNVLPYVEDLKQLNLSHMSITINAVDPAIGEKIYSWIRDGKVIYRGRQAAEILLERQLATIKALKEAGIIVKVNTVTIPGINDRHVLEVSKKMAELGVDIQNCMVIYPNQGTPFENIKEPSPEEIGAIRKEAEKHLPQMRHCTRCRADAVGLLGKDLSPERTNELMKQASTAGPSLQGRPYVAVATLEGMLVNQHLGEAYKFQIWAKGNGDYVLVEEREAPETGGGKERWNEMVRIFKDCRAVLVSGIGESPRKVLEENGIVPVEMNGFIVEGLKTVYEGGNLESLKSRPLTDRKGCGCSGNGLGCG
ncbi:MAG: nitrogenase cofactor biosynthesis protein NifB [Desulfomonilaceae bacterium]